MAPKQLEVGGLLENGKLLPPDRREVESKLDNTRCGVMITVCGDFMTFEFECQFNRELNLRKKFKKSL